MSLQSVHEKLGLTIEWHSKEKLRLGDEILLVHPKREL